jgi:muramidase (phage lysozyme)
MSYRDPKQFVDKQTGAYYRDLQKTFGGITDDYIKQLNDRQAQETELLKQHAKRNAKRVADQEAWKNKTGSALNKVTQSSSSIFQEPKFQLKLSETLDTAGGLIGKPMMKPEERNYATNIENLGSSINDFNENLVVVGEGYDEQMGRGNNFGGISPYNDPDLMSAVATTLGRGTTGKAEADFDANGVGSSNLYVKYTSDEEGSKPFNLSAQTVQEVMNNPEAQLLVTIPDETKDMENIAATAYDSDGKLKEMYFTGGEKSRINKDGNKEYYKEFNEDLFLQEIKGDVVANVQSLSRPQQFALYNFFQDKANIEGENCLFNLEHKFEDKQEEEEFLNDLSIKYATWTSGSFVDGSKEVVTRTEEIYDTQFIEDYSIPIKTGPVEENGGLVNIPDLESVISRDGFRTSNPQVINGREAITVTKSVEGADRSATIYDNMNEAEVKNVLKFIETGVNPSQNTENSDPVDMPPPANTGVDTTSKNDEATSDDIDSGVSSDDTQESTTTKTQDDSERNIDEQGVFYGGGNGLLEGDPSDVQRKLDKRLKDIGFYVDVEGTGRIGGKNTITIVNEEGNKLTIADYDNPSNRLDNIKKVQDFTGINVPTYSEVAYGIARGIAAEGESGSYNAVFGDSKGVKNKLTEMTVNEVLKFQKNLIDTKNKERNEIAGAIISGKQTPEWTKKIKAYEKKNGPIPKSAYSDEEQMREIVKKISPYSSASGKYQYIYDTLLSKVTDGTLKGTEKFDEKTQDYLADSTLKDIGIDKYLEGKIPIEKFIKKIARTWASVPKNASGEGAYDTDGINKASGNYAEIKSRLEEMKKQYEQGKGKSSRYSDIAANNSANKNKINFG